VTMELIDGQLILSATDLINYLECGHLTWLDRERAEGGGRRSCRDGG